MNLFRVLGDLPHYLAILTIFIKIISSKSCKGISGKSQIVFLFVFITRYLDVFTNFISMYNTSIKIFFILSTLINIFLVFVKYRGAISSDLDTIRIEILILGAAVLAFFIHHEFVMMELLWTFSVYLEAVSIIPQLSVSSHGKSVKLLYLMALGYQNCYTSSTGSTDTTMRASTTSSLSPLALFKQLFMLTSLFFTPSRDWHILSQISRCNFVVLSLKKLQIGNFVVQCKFS